MRTDNELVVDFKQGSAAEKDKVFAELLRRHREKIYWLCRKMVHTHEDADDVAQNVFIKVHRSLVGFNGESMFSTWIYRIATNESINYLRAQKARQATSLDDMIYEPVDADAQPSMNAEQDEQRLMIEDAINALPEKQRVVFTMRYYEELSYEEIADIVGTSVGGLKANYFHAFKKIEDYLKLRLTQTSSR
jgi:RNA polymerase sigma-70 factor, ECF subfamily